MRAFSALLSVLLKAFTAIVSAYFTCIHEPASEVVMEGRWQLGAGMRKWIECEASVWMAACVRGAEVFYHVWMLPLVTFVREEVDVFPCNLEVDGLIVTLRARSAVSSWARTTRGEGATLTIFETKNRGLDSKSHVMLAHELHRK